MDKQSTYRQTNIILSDHDAKVILLSELPRNEIGATLLKVAVNASSLYSFVDHQTYPRQSHPLKRKRLDPKFTFAAIITSLRCTLETEQRVVNDLIQITNGQSDLLVTIETDRLRDIIRSAGMAVQKSRWITSGLALLSSDPEYDLNILINLPLEETRQRLLNLKGMGPKAVDCFMLLGLDMPVFPVDVNVFKVVSTLFPDKITGSSSVLPSFSNARHVLAAKSLLEESFIQDTKLYQILHTYLLLAGKYRMVI